MFECFEKMIKLERERATRIDEDKAVQIYLEMELEKTNLEIVYSNDIAGRTMRAIKRASS